MGIALKARPEALADVPGVGDLSLTRAVIQYRDGHQLDRGAGRIDDIGLGLVLDGEYAASAEVLELGSGTIRQLDLSAELVILDWVYEPTLDHVRLLLDTPRDLSLMSGGVVPGPLVQYCQAITLSVLGRVGYNALTRPTVLRMGFRDIVRDLDMNERTAVRIAIAPDDVATVSFIYDENSLYIERCRATPDAGFERLLLDAFPGADVRRCYVDSGTAYHLLFPLPLVLAEARALMDQLRLGLLRLYARYEPDRYAHIRRSIDTFGPRDTLEQLDRGQARVPCVRLRELYGAVSVV
ncbi:MAG TPA: hypothetical protein VKZ58_05440 [Longimicrobiales bacterium]|nr:hypothetical protein [Longimicrobiales bacterium]